MLREKKEMKQFDKVDGTKVITLSSYFYIFNINIIRKYCKMGKSLQFIDALDSQSPRKLRTKEKKKSNRK